MRAIAELGIRSRCGLLLWTAAMAFATMACDGADGKLDAVRAFAQGAGTATPVFAAVANDYYGACVRTYNWEYGALPDTEKLRFQPVEDWCGPTSAPASPGSSAPPPPPWHAFEGARQWQKTNDVLLAYLKGLGDLAAGQANDYGIPHFVDDIVQLNSQTNWFNLDSSTTATVKNFGVWIAQTYFAAKRKAAIADVLPAADPYVQDLTRGLGEIATTHYKNEALFSEGTALNKFYMTTHDPGQPPPSLADRVQWMHDRQILAERYVAVDAYVDALDKIAKAHAALVKVFSAGAAAYPAERDHLFAEFEHDVAVLAHAYGGDGGTK